jgi:hypothetical protein
LKDRDFTVRKYSELLDAFKEAGYDFQTVENYVRKPNNRVVILRHDVDSWPKNALQMAELENKSSIKSTYYFRKSWLSFKENIVQRIVGYGHEIGYHYEDLSSAKGNYKKAIKRFRENLSFLRKYYPVTTIAMHGRPLSKWDSKDIWNKYDYHSYSLITEPYLDFNFNEIFYLTDTGNRWDGDKYSIRDYVQSAYSYEIHNTNELIKHIQGGLLPNKIMLSVHPARWNNSFIKWWIRYYILTFPKLLIKKSIKYKRKVCYEKSQDHSIL